mmetsp:Transcript_7916/g.23492  ORF Transcript_7916/g.23492 Transcript_7916/m.23492 type:complete len:151 (-) Transcript_7916:29-481(-)
MAAARRAPRGGVFGLLLAALVMADFAFPQLRTFMMNCCDNSGAYRLKVMGKRGKGRCEPGDYRTIQAGDEVVVVGRTGGAKNRVMKAVVVRTRKMSANPMQNGFKVVYDQAAAVVMDNDGNPVGSKITGPVDPKCAQRWPKIAMISRGSR